MHNFLLVLICCSCVHIDGVYGIDFLKRISVPQYAFVGESATISCEFDLNQSQLYSLKWYHNRTEFYRYVPTERSGPINIRPSHKFVLHEVSRTERRVILSLSQLTMLASGDYRCEVIAEHPSFRTETLTGKMTVLREPLYPPIITGARPIYEIDDVIEIGCQSLRSDESGGPRASIQWYFNGDMVNPNTLSGYPETEARRKGVIMRVSPDEVDELGGSVIVECSLELGSHQKRARKTIRVKKRTFSYLDTLLGNHGCRCVSLNVSIVSTCLLFLVMSFWYSKY